MPDGHQARQTPAVLASDAERSDVVRILEQAMAEGRLTPVEAEDRERPDEFAVKPERYQPRKPLELEREPFERDEDFLGWLDSIRLKEL